MADMMIPEGWKRKKVGELSLVKRGASPRPIQDPKWWGGDIGWVRISDVTSSQKYLLKTTQYLSKEGVEKSVQIPIGEVVLSICATIGRPIIIGLDACIHDGFVWFDKLKNTIDREFWYYFLASKESFLSSQRQSGTQGNLNTSIVAELECLLPPLPEQQKIATILTSVDTVIEKTRAQIDKLKHLKTAMMQELLTQGIGHTEFKDTPIGRIPKAWKVISLGKAGSWKGGGTPSKANKEFWSGNIPWVSPKDMKSEFIEKTEDYITEHAITASSTNSIPTGSILIVARSGILKHTLPVAITAVDVTINQDMKALIVNDKVLALYLFHYLKANNHKVLRATLKAGNTVESLDFSEFSQHQIPLPPVSEQQKIINVMESIANRLRSKQQQLKSYEQTKKALMQDLLTGKVRVHRPYEV